MTGMAQGRGTMPARRSQRSRGLIDSGIAVAPVEPTSRPRPEDYHNDLEFRVADTSALFPAGEEKPAGTGQDKGATGIQPKSLFRLGGEFRLAGKIQS